MGEISYKNTNQELEEFLEKLGKLASRVRALRNKPLLIMYYPEDMGQIHDDDVEEIQKEFRRNNLKWKEEKLDLDILLHTYGGDPNAAYLLIQAIHDYSKAVTALVPYYAFSAGTLMCLGTHKLLLGAQSLLSPIDIHFGELALINVDYYLELITNCRERIEEALRKSEKDYRLPSGFLKTNLEEPLLVELAKQVGTLNLGKLFRERTITGYYANTLLKNYMLKNHTDKNERTKEIIQKLLFDAPSHQFSIDYHLAKEWGLEVSEMAEEESNLTKGIINLLREARNKGIICKYIKENYRLPFFKIYL